MGYKILFIDEESTQHDRFLDYFEHVCPEIKPTCLFPKANVDEMVDIIRELQPDAVVTDFKLNEIRVDIDYNVNYDGVELISNLRRLYHNFPCFVITSFDDDAVNVSDDVNLVYIKDLLKPDNDKAKVPFAQRILSQIDKYRARIDAARIELSVLIDKRNSGKAGVHEEDRIIQLDSFLERAFDAYDAVPSEMKKLSNLEKLNELIEKADEILKKLE